MEINQQLIKSCQAKNRAAQKELYLALLPYLRAMISRYLRDSSFEKDALQESFVKIFRSLEKYAPDKAPLKNWAARIVINTCLNYNERVIGLPTEEFIPETHDTDTSERIRVEEITDERMLDVLKQMPTGYFEIFNLFVIDEYSHKEIATMLNIAEAVSRKKLSRAKNWLRKSGALATI